MKENIGKKLFILGFVIFILSLILPIKLLEGFTNIKPIGLSSLFICPLIGLVGLIFAIKEGKTLWGILNLILILLFPLSMSLGYLLLGA